MDVGCSVKGSTASVIAYWDSFDNSIIKDFSQLSQIWGCVCGGNYFSELSQIWGNLCGGNGVSVLPYPHPQLFKVFKHLIYV